MVSWPEGVNTRILRQTAWTVPLGIIEDETRSGKTKRRLMTASKRKSFSVVMYFKEGEYELFMYWWKNVCRYGLNSFSFPIVDSSKTALKEYRFASGSDLSVSNPDGKIVKVSMQWEEL